MPHCNILTRSHTQPHTETLPECCAGTHCIEWSQMWNSSSALLVVFCKFFKKIPKQFKKILKWRRTMSDFKEIAASIGYPQFSSIQDLPLRPFFNGTPRPPLLVIAMQTATHCNCSTLAHNPCQATLRSFPWTGYYRARSAARRGSRATLFSCNTGLQYTATRCNVLQPQGKKESNGVGAGYFCTQLDQLINRWFSRLHIWLISYPRTAFIDDGCRSWILHPQRSSVPPQKSHT